MAIQQPHGETENGTAKSLNVEGGAGAKKACLTKTEGYDLACFDLS